MSSADEENTGHLVAAFREVLDTAAVQRGWKMSRVARRAELDPGTIAKLRSGKRELNSRYLHKLATALELDPIEFVMDIAETALDHQRRALASRVTLDLVNVGAAHKAHLKALIQSLQRGDRFTVFMLGSPFDFFFQDLHEEIRQATIRGAQICYVVPGLVESDLDDWPPQVRAYFIQNGGLNPRTMFQVWTQIVGTAPEEFACDALFLTAEQLLFVAPWTRFLLIERSDREAESEAWIEVRILLESNEAAAQRASVRLPSYAVPVLQSVVESLSVRREESKTA